MVANGVRRSWETAPISAWRSRSISSSSSERRACSRSWARSRARAAWLVKVRSRARSASVAGIPRMARIPTGRPEADRATVPIPSGAPGAVPRLTGTPERGSSWPSSSGESASPYEAAISSLSPSGTSSITPGTVEHGADGPHDGLQQLLDRPLVDQQLGQLEEPLRLGGPHQGLRARRLQVGHHPGHRQHDHRVHRERHPVLRPFDTEPAVGRDEAEVVDEEPGQHTRGAGREAADDHAGHDRKHEDQGGDGNAQVGTQGQEGGAEPQREGDPHQRADQTSVHLTIVVRIQAFGPGSGAC